MGNRVIQNHMIYILILIFLISLILAIRSMKDFDLPKEIKSILKIKKVRGRIVFFKDKVAHYKN